MTVASPPRAQIDLGGGFSYWRRDEHDAAIVGPALAGGLCTALMSTAQSNARDQGATQAWLQRWGCMPVRGLRGCNQVHGTRLVQVTAAEDAAQPDADGMWTSSPEVGLLVKAADCAPLWFANRHSGRIALVHAGWRGVAAGIVEGACAVVGNGGHLAVAVGPHLQACCFEIGPEVAQHFSAIPGALLPPERLRVARRRTDSVALDLSAAIAAACAQQGIPADAVAVSTACTRCHPEMFHSYRRNGTGGPLMAAVAAISS